MVDIAEKNKTMGASTKIQSDLTISDFEDKSNSKEPSTLQNNTVIKNESQSTTLGYAPQIGGIFRMS